MKNNFFEKIMKKGKKSMKNNVKIFKNYFDSNLVEFASLQFSQLH